MLALVSENPRAIVAVFAAVPNPLKLPNGDQVAGAALGWSNARFSLVEVVAFTPAPGEIATGRPAYNLDQAGAVREIYATAPAPARAAPMLSASEFRGLFSPAEKAAITTAGESDVNVRIFMDDAGAAELIDLASPAVAQGLAYLVARQLLAPDRAAQVAAGERPAL